MFRFKRNIFIVCAVIALIPGLVFAASSGKFAGAPLPIQKASPGLLKGTNPIPNQYIVVFKDDAVRVVANNIGAFADGLALQYQATVDATWSHALKGMAAYMHPKQAEAMAKDPRVAWIEEDNLIQLDATQTGATWGLDRIDQRSLPLNGTYTYTTAGLGVTAYVIDSGIRITHQQFGGRASSGFTAIDDGNGSNDCHGHGTHVAGTIAGTTYGVAKNAKLVAVRVLNCYGSGYSSGVISGIDWVTANKHLPAVANMSLGGSYSAALNAAVTNSSNAGITYAVAAGNDYGADACGLSPASTPAAITVGATDNSDSRASYSNIGTCLDIFAPGSNVTSAWMTSDTATNTISGTSMATPHVAGAIAILLGTRPAATPVQVALALAQSATPGKVADPGTGSPNKLLYSYTTPPDTVLPTVNLTAPTANTTLKGNVTLAANATDNVRMAHVTFFSNFAGGTQIGTADATSPYTISWNSLAIPNGRYTFTAKATDSAGNVKTSAPVAASVANTGPCVNGGQMILNPGFELGGQNWTADRGVIFNIGSGGTHGGTSLAWLGGYGATHTDDIYQQVSIPSNACTAVFRFWLKIDTEETSSTVPSDAMTITVRDTAGTVLSTIAAYTNLNASTGYLLKSFDLIAYKGKTVRLQFHGVEDYNDATSFFVDDVALIIRR